ncbi:hypothetical protein [Streptomyces javensis]|uniref:Uncharacterized protein n=1 Tax=Streptomyces javensis TaxID=114698 RepID=A0ABS0R4K9_9ACTN|nr:hypothetical protein [Streptomyces javensis]MBI0312023.1 hypothetical protein [Streptomyces javensis]
MPQDVVEALEPQTQEQPVPTIQYVDAYGLLWERKGGHPPRQMVTIAITPDKGFTIS